MDINQRLAKIFNTIFGLEESKFNDKLTSSEVPNWDSIGHMSLLISIESEFNLQLDIEDASKLQNVKEIVQYLEAKLAPPKKWGTL